ncbi:MAG: DUF2155 domain-containing protein [Alphaproteobacteria bacterium]|nr:DUF2155 domain-containing protein [Alphaproteobacteria bacterium]
MGVRRAVVMQGLDKITGRTSEFLAPIGVPVSFFRLSITARACKERPPEETPETAAFLEIVENTLDGSLEREFSGWMFASSPALNALENPVYDVWVVSCKTDAPTEAGLGRSPAPRASAAPVAAPPEPVIEEVPPPAPPPLPKPDRESYSTRSSE